LIDEGQVVLIHVAIQVEIGRFAPPPPRGGPSPAPVGNQGMGAIVFIHVAVLVEVRGDVQQFDEDVV
jgi:hypothetical protein